MSENSISTTSSEVLVTEVNRLTVSDTERKTAGQQQQQQLVIQRSGSSNESPSLSRDVSTELYTDFCGVDSQQFLMKTLQENVKSRSFLIGIEKDMLSFIRDESASTYKFPAMNTFNRMLTHRVAAFFGLDHCVEKRSPDCVTVSKCDKTRIPDMKFEEVAVLPEALNHASSTDNHVSEPKQVLKRSDGKGASFEKSPDRRNNHHHHHSNSGGGGRNDNGMKKSGSYEERQVRYQHARDRIFASQASSSSDGGGDASSGISSNMDVTANSSLKSSQDNVSSKAWSSFESGTVSTSRRLKRQNRVIGSLDSENMTTSSHFLTPDYHSFSQEGPAAATGKKLGVVPKASSFGGVTECSTKAIDLKANDSRLPRNNSFNTTTTENGGSGDARNVVVVTAAAVKKREAASPNLHEDEKVNNSDCDPDEDPDAISSHSTSNYSANATISPIESNAQSGPASEMTSNSSPADASSQITGSGSGILPKPPLIHQSSAPDSNSSSGGGGGGRNLSHHPQQQTHGNYRQNWQSSHHHSFSYQNQYPQSQGPPGRWQRNEQNYYHSAHYSGPRHRYPRTSYNSPAHSSGQHYVTQSSLPPPGGAIPANPAAVGFWSPHPDLRSPNPIHLVMSPKDVQLAAQQQQMMMQGMNLIQNSEQMPSSGMFVSQEAAGAQMMPNHYSTQNHRTNANGYRTHHESSSTPSHYTNQSRGRQNLHQHHPQQQQSQPPPPLSLPAATAGLYYVNPQYQSAPGITPQPFVMLSPRLPANATTFATPQYANQQLHQQQTPDSSGIPVSMPISYSSIPTATATGVPQPVAYFVSGVPPASNAGLLPVPYAAYPSPTTGSVTMPNPFPSAYPAAVSYDPSCLTSYPEYRLFTSSSPTQSMNPAVLPVISQAAAAGTPYVKHSPPPSTGQQQQQQQQQNPTPDATPPLGPGPVNPQYFSGYTICAPSTLPHSAMAPPLAVNQYGHMGMGMNPNHSTHYTHQYHQPRSRNPNHSGSKHHYRST